jgi:hypothetical protein
MSTYCRILLSKSHVVRDGNFELARCKCWRHDASDEEILRKIE